MHITEAMHRWQFVKKSSAVQTPIFSGNPNHKNTAGKRSQKFQTFHGCTWWCHLSNISSEGVYSSRDATVHLSRDLHSKRKNCGAQAKSDNGEVVQKAASKPSLQAEKHNLTALQRLPECTRYSFTEARKKSCTSKQQKRFGSPACIVHTPKCLTQCNCRPHAKP